jgi:hypothetical protein
MKLTGINLQLGCGMCLLHITALELLGVFFCGADPKAL